MLISRGTLQRALRWSSFLLFWALAVSAPAQESGRTVAVLLTAPRRSAGIEWLEPNVIEHWSARYRAGETEFDLLYTTGGIEDGIPWSASECRRRLLRVSPDGRYLHTNNGWSIVLSPVDGSLPPQLMCEFVDLFVMRFLFFLDLQTDLPSAADRPPFPAVLETAP